ncbi:hypothetical protein MASSI9I_140003 [Massilia sp. 9I]|nr:hypothetical protein MASSI9I_140003 [Massilia sp. 9I]
MREPAYALAVGALGRRGRVVQAILADIGQAVLLGRIGPPIRAKAEEVVLVAAGRAQGLVDDAVAAVRQGRIGFLEQAVVRRLVERIARRELLLCQRQVGRIVGVELGRRGCKRGTAQHRRQHGRMPQGPEHGDAARPLTMRFGGPYLFGLFVQSLSPSFI